MTRKKQPRGVASRQDFIDHIQRVEAYLNGASLEEVEQDELSAELIDPDAEAYAARLYDTFADSDNKED